MLGCCRFLQFSDNHCGNYKNVKCQQGICQDDRHIRAECRDLLSIDVSQHNTPLVNAGQFIKGQLQGSVEFSLSILADAVNAAVSFDEAVIGSSVTVDL